MNITVTLDTDTTKHRAYYHSEPRRRWIGGRWQDYGTRTVTNRRASDRPDGNGIVYLSFEGETLLDNLINRTSRPWLILKPFVVQTLQDAGIDTTGIRWSQKAGCSCPCSPGALLPNYRGHDVWLKVSMDVPARTNDEEAALRAAQILADPTLVPMLS